MNKGLLYLLQRFTSLFLCLSLLLTPADMGKLIENTAETTEEYTEMTEPEETTSGGEEAAAEAEETTVQPETTEIMEPEETSGAEEVIEAETEGTPEPEETSGAEEVVEAETEEIPEPEEASGAEEVIETEPEDTPEPPVSAEGVISIDYDGRYKGIASAGNVSVVVSCTDEAHIPEGTVISVEEISADSDTYYDLISRSGDTLYAEHKDEPIDFAYARFFDISFMAGGVQIEPSAPVSVEIIYDRPSLDYENYDIMTEVIHFIGDEPVLMDTVRKQGTETSAKLSLRGAKAPETAVSDRVMFEADSFSAYGLLFYHADGNNIGNMLDGMTVGLVRWEHSENIDVTKTGTALTAEEHSTGRLVAQTVTTYPRSKVDSEEDFTQYAITDFGITQWTFTYISGNSYYVTTDVDGVTKYLTIRNGSLVLLDAPDADGYSEIIVQNDGSGDLAGKIKLRNRNNYAVNLRNNNQKQGFQSSNWSAEHGQATTNVGEWFAPAVLADVKSEIHTAQKVSASDRVNFSDSADVVIYSKIWDSGTESYVNYAINGNGELVKVWESGDVVQWKDVSDTSIYWKFIEHENGYYDFYNPVTGMYLAPQNGQLLSNNMIGVTLTGRENGEYRSSIEAWDGNIWSWYGYKYTDDKKLLPVPDTASDQLCFAVKKPNQPFLPVETVDSKAEGITIKMFDYNKGAGTVERDPLQTAIMGENQYMGDGKGARTGLVEKILVDGFPVATRTHKSLDTLFTDNDQIRSAHEANHLFIKSTYDETGYFEYSCFDNSAFLMKENGDGQTPSAEGYDGVYDFTVMQELASPGNSKDTYKRGNFLPYDMADANDNDSSNLFDGNLQPLTEDNPRYDEQIFSQRSTDYFFGMSLEATFMMPENGCDENGNPLIFEFNGDDDFWLFIDDVLVIDLGGIHNALTGSINFQTGEVKMYNGSTANTYTVKKLIDCFREAGVFPDGSPWDDSKVSSYFKNDGSFASNEGIFKDYSSHKMKMFYMERGRGASNLKLRFNLATVPENSVFLEKQLTGTKTTDYSNTRYPFQLWYKPEGSEEYILYENPGDETKKARFEGRSELVPYDAAAVINGRTYNNVFYLRAGEKAEFILPDQGTEYFFKELGIRNAEYDYVKINNETAFRSDGDYTYAEQETYTVGDGEMSGNYTDISSVEDIVSSRKRVIYENHVDPDFLRKLKITKKLVRLEGEDEIPVEDDKTGFEFQIFFLDENGEPVPYSKGEYYVVDEDNNYYGYVGGKLTKLGREKTVCSISGNNGSVAGIPVGLSVVIEDLLPTTGFYVYEEGNKIPLGYQLLRYERGYVNGDATYSLYNSSEVNKGIIRENIDANMTVVNQKGFGITVNKDWADKEYTDTHETIYIALFRSDDDSFVPGTLRSLVSPETAVYYFNDQDEASQYYSREIKKDTIQPDGWESDLSSVTYCEPYSEGEWTRLAASPIGESDSDFNYSIGYEQGYIEGSGHNVRTDTITNSRDHLRILKKTPDGHPLADAVFTLTDITGTPRVIGEFTSDDDGLVTDAYLTPDHRYKLSETSAPDGFKKLSDDIIIIVNSDGTLSIEPGAEDAEQIEIELSDDGKSGTLIVTDDNYGISLRKTDTQGEPLSGAVFRIYRYDKANGRKYTNSGTERLISDHNGVFFSGKLNSGYYLIEETAPPGGYAGLDYQVVMHIRLQDGKVDELYKVNYNSETERYEEAESVLEEWNTETAESSTIRFPNEKVSGNLIIRKTIDDTDPEKGNPTFMFRVTQIKDASGNTVSSGEQYIRCIPFSAAAGGTSGEIRIEDMPIGTYIVEELSTLTYDPVSLTVDGDEHAIISSSTVATVKLQTDDPVTVSYNNKLNDNDGYTTYADNRIDYPDPQGEEE